MHFASSTTPLKQRCGVSGPAYSIPYLSSSHCPSIPKNMASALWSDPNKGDDVIRLLDFMSEHEDLRNLSCNGNSPPQRPLQPGTSSIQKYLQRTSTDRKLYIIISLLIIVFPSLLFVLARFAVRLHNLEVDDRQWNQLHYIMTKASLPRKRGPSTANMNG